VFVALVPLTILLTAYLPPSSGLSNYGDLVARAFTLHGRSAEAIKHAFVLGTASRHAMSIAATAGFLVAGYDLTNALQTTYDRAWGCQSLTGWRSGLRATLWIAMAALFQLVMTVLGSMAGPAPWSEALLVTLVTIPASLVFWLVTPGLLLSRRMGWRHLLPGAIVCTVGLVALQGASSLFLPPTIDQYYRLFGQIGVAVALLFWVWLTSLLWVLGAVLSAVMWERRTGGTPAALARTRHPKVAGLRRRRRPS
jgi:membrane protein